MALAAAMVSVGVAPIATALPAAASPAAPATAQPKAAVGTGCAPSKATVNGNRGRFGGVVPPVQLPGVSAACRQPANADPPNAGPPTADPATAAPSFNGTPPLLYGGGPVMGTSGVATVTPIYWTGALSIPAAYQNIINGYLTNMAADSGGPTNVFSTVTQYTNGVNHIHYNIAAGTPLVDTHAFPTSGGCTRDTGAVYSDSTGYSACVTDSQLIAELSSYLTAHSLPRDLNHLYMVYFPKGVESCFGNANAAGGGDCSLNVFCGYHSAFGTVASPAIYASMPYAVPDGANGTTCSSDGGGVGNQSPNGNLDADTEVSISSHEILEAITDPEPNSGWIDSSGGENGDDCSYIYGSGFGGPAGAKYNQTINGAHYFTQEEFSNQDWAINHATACVQHEDPPVASFIVTTPSPIAGSPVAFNGSASIELDNPAPGAITAYSWDFGDSSAAGSGVAPSHTYTAAGTYTVKLTVTDVDLFQGTLSQQVVIGTGLTIPAITWANPVDIAYGTALGATQLNAIAGVVGTFSYAPPAGTFLGAGNAQSLTVTFAPTDLATYASVSASVHINVAKAPLLVTADNKTRPAGAANPPLTSTITGFVHGDAASVVTGVPLLSTTATAASAVGSYPIVIAPGTLTAANYAFSPVGGTLTVTINHATFTYPVAGQTNVDTTQAFAWTPLPGAQNYYLTVGTTMFGTDLASSGVLAPGQASFGVPALPVGPTLFATVLTLLGGAWNYQSVTFTAAPGLATFSYPTNGQPNVDTTQAFTWLGIPQAQAYILTVGTTVYGSDLVNSGILPPGQTSFSVPALPAGVLYATLLTKVNGSFTRFQLVAFTAAGGQANFTYPLNGATSVDTTQLFSWSTVPQAQAYFLLVGTTVYGGDLVNTGILPKTTSTFDVGALPTGRTLYATLFTEIGGAWARFQAITFTAAAGTATLTNPTTGLNVATPTSFTWSTIAAGQGYLLVIGTTMYGSDLFNSGILPAGQSSVPVPALPTGRSLYATLLTKVNGAFTRSQFVVFTAH